MMIARRNILKAAGALPFVKKAAVEQSVKELTGISLGPTISGAGDTCIESVANRSAGITRDVFKKFLHDKAFRDEFESLTFEQESRITSIDHDLASKKSFSLAAKVTYQRQRNVQHRMDQEYADGPWTKKDNLVATVAQKLFGLLR